MFQRYLELGQPPGSLTIGFAEANGQQLFLEHYLDVPVQQALAQLTHRPFDRCRIPTHL